jgi:phage tail-like protein
MRRMTRLDPYKNFKFRLQAGNAAYAGSRLTGVISALPAVQDILEYRSGGDASGPRKSPGRSKYDPILLSRGLTQDTAFSNWASQVMDYGSLLGAKASVILELYDEAGTLVVRYTLNGSTVSEAPMSPRSAIRQYYVAAGTSASVNQQLATIFENALRRLRPSPQG